MAPWLALTSFAAYKTSVLAKGGPQKGGRDTDGEKGADTSKDRCRGRECLQKVNFKLS